MTSLDGWPIESLAASEWYEGCRRSKEEHGLNFLAHLTAVHHIDDGRFEVVAFAYAVASHERIGSRRRLLRTEISDEVGVCLPSVAPIWPTAEWHEREVWDMFGIHFEGHPDLRRILMEEDYDAHPLRKDFVDCKPNLGVSQETLAKDAAEKEPVRVGQETGDET